MFIAYARTLDRSAFKRRRVSSALQKPEVMTFFCVRKAFTVVNLVLRLQWMRNNWVILSFFFCTKNSYSRQPPSPAAAPPARPPSPASSAPVTHTAGHQQQLQHRPPAPAGHQHQPSSHSTSTSPASQQLQPRQPAPAQQPASQHRTSHPATSSSSSRPPAAELLVASQKDGS